MGNNLINTVNGQSKMKEINEVIDKVKSALYELDIKIMDSKLDVTLFCDIFVYDGNYEYLTGLRSTKGPTDTLLIQLDCLKEDLNNEAEGYVIW